MRTSHNRFRSRAGFTWLVALLIMTNLQMASPDVTTAEQCVPTIAGNDTSNGDVHGSPWFGEAHGQTFIALDTLIRSITVWRWAVQDTNVYGMHIFILETDSLGRPAPNSVILDGPTVYNTFGDGEHHIPFRFEFDPPFALPGPGKYEFAILGEPCMGLFEMLYDSTDSYPDGEVWIHGRTVFTGCRVRNYPKLAIGGDTIFQIEFCRPPTTDVPIPRGDSWGTIKAHYR